MPLTFYILLWLFLCSPHLQATQHALVVGINQYPPGTDSLKGAVNDARLIAQALRKIEVQLPKERVLLDSQATRANILQAWQQMVKQAQPGDTLIFTYAGHGSQQEDALPRDEADGKDETLVLYDGVLRDDELTELFAQASSYQIVFVADSCHSGGIIRTKDFPSQEICRFTAERGSLGTPIPSLSMTTPGDEKAELKNITVITAQQSDSLKVCETTLENQAHGALSYFFAQALSGLADGNENLTLERSELDNYLTEKVKNLLDGLQTPQLRPRSGDHSVIVLQGNQVTPTPAPSINPEISAVAIWVEGGQPPPGLKNIRFVSDPSFELRFVVQGEQTVVFNSTGNKVVTLSPSRDNGQWQPVINKQRLLKALETQFDMRLQRVEINLQEENGVHQKGDVYQKGDLLHFTILPPKDPQLKALTLFNLTGNGRLQFLYPLDRKQHSATVTQFPYELKPIRVIEPFGGDHLVAILCMEQPVELQQFLQKNLFSHEPLVVVEKLQQQQCQVGQYAFFTKEKE